MRPTKPVLAAAALLMLAGCSATHVGDSWQCPLVQGTKCTSVADADPMVPDENAKEVAPTDAPLAPMPLYRPRDPGEPVAAPRAARSCEGACGEGFDPFAWLAGLFARIAGEDDALEAGAGAVTPGEPGAARPVAVDPAAPSASPLPGAPEPGAVAAAEGPEPAPPQPAVPETAALLPGEPADADLREPEVIGRIWIAPFVDAKGHYREGSWVRAVLEPAGWRVR